MIFKALRVHDFCSGRSADRADLAVALRGLIGFAAGGLIAFTLSVDDFLITYFTAGVGASTLPIRIYSMVKRGVTPDINALSALVLIATLFTIYLGLKFLHKTEN